MTVPSFVAAALLLAGCNRERPSEDMHDGGPGDPALVDHDEDGATADVDCDDDDPTIYPDAYDAPRDGIDQDCDGADGNVSPLDAVADGIFYGPRSVMTAGATLLADADVTGDGIVDLVVGAPSVAGDDPIADPGLIYVIAGAKDLGGALPERATATGLDRELGAWLSSGDFDGDGDVDLLARSRGENSLGMAQLIHGPFSAEIDLSQAPRIVASGGDVIFQTFVAGDLDGDARDDVAVDIPTMMYEWPISSKQIHVFSAASVVGIVDLASPDATLAEEPHTITSGTGLQTKRGGDADGDGLEDWLVGCPDHGADAGRAWLTPQPPMGWSSLDDLAIGAWDGEHDGALAGGTVTAVGDTNGDGLGDWLVGSHYVDTDAERGGRAYLLTELPDGEERLDEAASTIVAGTVPYGWLGLAASAVGDINDDGLADLLVSAPGDPYRSDEPGSVMLFASPFGGVIEPLDAFRKWDGGSAGDMTGKAVAAGDLNADGWVDIAVGAPWLDDSELGDDGRVYVFLGPDYAL